MNPWRGTSRMKVFPGLLSTIIVAAALALWGCAATGTFSARAICERAGGDYVGNTCEHHVTPAELAAQQWCETHGGVWVTGNGCELGSGGP
jgi:hypothetical protein